MPPPLPVDSDAESNAAVADDIELIDVAEKPENEEEEGDDDDEELYVVEKILAHHNNFKDDKMRYEIKWKGYEAEEDRTWETEDNLRWAPSCSLSSPGLQRPLTSNFQHSGAREILEAYWVKIGGKPVPAPKTKGKKRGRQSTGSQVEPAKKQKKKGRKSTSAIPDPDATPEPPPGYTDVDSDAWTPPPPNDNAWDPLIMTVDTIEKDSEGELWAYLVWNEKNDDGRFNRSKARLVS
ncbi:MAG: hypothetical protein Q9170_006053 [Blastenia crenularia]